MPPVARITARAETVSDAPSRERSARPVARPSSVAIAVAASGSSTSTRSCVAASAESARVMRRPVADASGVHDPALRVPTLESEREVAASVCVELDAELLEMAHAVGRLLAEHADRALAGGLAAGGERVVGVLCGRVVRGQRRGDPALCPVAGGLSERRAAHERDARPLVGGHERRIEARRRRRQQLRRRC